MKNIELTDQSSERRPGDIDIHRIPCSWAFKVKRKLSIIISCTKYKRYSLLIKSKGIITIKHETIQGSVGSNTK